MCYDIQAKMETQFRRAVLNNDNAEVDRLREILRKFTDNPLYHAYGFAHPELLIYTDRDPYKPTISRWGLIPSWVKEEQQAVDLSRKTLNARGETIFEKPSFRQSAEYKRCVIDIDGFFEHRHHNGNAYPYFIRRRDELPMSLAGLWNEWCNPATGEIINSFAIVTTKANELMSKVHNNPKLPEPRMPLILEADYEHLWIGYDEDFSLDRVRTLIAPYPYEDELIAYPVHRLRGKSYLGNCPEITDPVLYEELDEL